MALIPRSVVGRLAAAFPSRGPATAGVEPASKDRESLPSRSSESSSHAPRGVGEGDTDDGDLSDERWRAAPLAELVEHIVTAYHQPLQEELPRLEAVARQALDQYGDSDWARLSEILSLCVCLRAELGQHMSKEEHILFPLIKRGYGWKAGGPISVMGQEHDSARSTLRRLHELTDGYHVSEDACDGLRALWHGLAALEESLSRHIHLEDDILFPRALAS